MSAPLPVNLAAFLKTGNLGALHCNLSTSEVENLLGEPQRTESYPDGHSLWSFGRLDVRFHEKIVNCIGLGFQGGDDWRLPDCLQVRGFVPDWDTTMEQMKQFLSDENIHFERGGIDGRLIRTEGGVWIHPTPDDQLMSMVIDSGPTAFQDRHFRGKFQM